MVLGFCLENRSQGCLHKVPGTGKIHAEMSSLRPGGYKSQIKVWAGPRSSPGSGWNPASLSGLLVVAPAWVILGLQLRHVDLCLCCHIAFALCVFCTSYRDTGHIGLGPK